MSARRPRADAATIDRRINIVIEAILKGESTRSILKHPDLADERGQLAPNTIRDYIRRARNEITALGEFDKAHEFGRALARLDQLYSKALDKDDINAARQVLADRMKMLGISGPIHIVTDENGQAVTSWFELVQKAAAAEQAQMDEGSIEP